MNRGGLRTGRRVALMGAAAAALAACGATGQPSITATVICREHSQLVTVAIGPAPAGYPSGSVHVAIGNSDNEVMAALADVFGDVEPGGEVSSTVPGPGEVPVLVTWPDETTTSRTVTAPACR